MWICSTPTGNILFSQFISVSVFLSFLLCFFPSTSPFPPISVCTKIKNCCDRVFVSPKYRKNTFYDRIWRNFRRKTLSLTFWFIFGCIIQIFVPCVFWLWCMPVNCSTDYVLVCRQQRLPVSSWILEFFFHKQKYFSNRKSRKTCKTKVFLSFHFGCCRIFSHIGQTLSIDTIDSILIFDILFLDKNPDSKKNHIHIHSQ